MFEIVLFLFGVLLGVGGGYIWRDHISRARHDLARRERRRNRIQMGLRDRSIDGTSREHSSYRE